MAVVTIMEEMSSSAHGVTMTVLTADEMD